ncbi:MAG: hypothetical protein JSV33_10700 [bacterium]|nr:MAG: hypothetical protein JSV33_10700 [bacterium]
MTFRGFVAVFFTILVAPAASLAQSCIGQDTLLSPVDTALEDSSSVFSSNSVLFLSNNDYLMNRTLTFSLKFGARSDRFSGFQIYRASRYECAFRGAGMGMTLGMAAGAFGMMTGDLDEKEAWYICGAMAALGALYGGLIKADDPTWNVRIRWDPDR